MQAAENFILGSRVKIGMPGTVARSRVIDAQQLFEAEKRQFVVSRRRL